jgi:hypothetical protein
MINHVNRQCKQNTVEKSLILTVCRADERTTNCYGVSVTAVKGIGQESRDKLFFIDKVHVIPYNVLQHCEGQISSE